MEEQGAQGLRVALYSHDSVGLGHTRRNLAIAEALAAHVPAATGRRLSGLLISGERTATSYRCPEGFDWVIVPGITKGGGNYTARNLAVGSKRLMDIRSAVIAGALSSFAPHIVIVDRHPFGVDGELEEPLRQLRAERPDVMFVLGLREVLDAPEVAAAEWERVGIQRVMNVFDRIWVYGDPAAHNPFDTGELHPDFAPITSFTGLLAEGRRSSGRTPAGHRPFVLTTAGGGSDGGALVRAAAAAPVPEGYHHLIVAGPQMPKVDRVAAEELAGEHTTVVKKVSDALSYIHGAEAVISMAGYNSSAEILSSQTPALAVPRVTPRTEQLIRARGLAATGAIDMLTPQEATPQAIGAWLHQAVSDADVAARQRAARATHQLDGLAVAALLAADLAAVSHRPVVAAQSPASAPVTAAEGSGAVDIRRAGRSAGGASRLARLRRVFTASTAEGVSNAAG